MCSSKTGINRFSVLIDCTFWFRKRSVWSLIVIIIAKFSPHSPIRLFLSCFLYQLQNGTTRITAISLLLLYLRLRGQNNYYLPQRRSSISLPTYKLPTLRRTPDCCYRRQKIRLRRRIVDNHHKEEDDDSVYQSIFPNFHPLLCHFLHINFRIY